MVAQRLTGNPVVPAGFRHGSDARVSTVAGAEFTSFNSLDHPDDVRLERTMLDVGRGTFWVTF